MAYFHSPLRLGAFALGLLPATALAGPAELLRGVVVHPTNPDMIVLRYENVLGGLFYSTDGARTFRIRPSLTFTRSGLRMDSTVAFAGDAVLIGNSDGLVKTDQNGCFVSNAIKGAFVDAVVTDPSDPDVAYFWTSRAENNLRTGLWQRDAKGAITPLGADSSSDLTVTGMQLAGTRFVQTALRGTNAVLRSSDDRGQTWKEQPIASTGTPRLVAIDPLDPQRIVVALQAKRAADPLLISRDGGASWQSYLDVLEVGQSAVASDGRLWIGDKGDPEMTVPTGALWFAARIGDAPERLLSNIAVTCLAHDATRDQVWLCQDYELDTFDPKSRNLCRVFALSQLEDFVDCEEDDLSRSVRAQEQMCTGYCGTLHFAEAPICDNYNDPVALCGPPARTFDVDAGYLDPAGSRARCGDGPLDAGVAVIEDAGLPSNAIDAGVGVEGKKDDGCALSSRGSFSGVLLALVALLRRRRRA